jgi:asparagine synthase (glutamine-hydrolysing)
MCGICGWVNWDGAADEAPVRRMEERLSHRGPDSAGRWRDPAGLAVLGHRRLAVLDPSDRASQPMLHGSGKVLVFNGEVYSFRELRRVLEDDGADFRSTGDTEVVLAALAKWGAAALSRFVGMFALALWDPGRRSLLLARDRFGVKPLFVATLPRGLAFASEIPALLAHPEVGRDVDRHAVARWLQQGYPSGRTTLVKGIWRLPAGHLLEAEGGKVWVRPWYDLLERVGPTERQSEDDVVDRLTELLQTAVECRLISDVPLGCYLSGGVDSTAVVAAAAAAGARPETLTVSFASGDDESAAARRTARAIGLDHRVERCTPVEMLEVFAGWYRIAGDPLADPSLAPTWVVSRAARQRWTVALSGDGGDELLGGYPRLQMMPRIERWMRTPAGLRSIVPPILPPRRWVAKLRSALRSRDRWGAYQALQGVWPAAEVARLCRLREAPPVWGPDLLARLDRRPSWLRYRLLDMLTFLPDRVLAKVDRASMAHSLEVRVPLLDHRVVELLLSLPPSMLRGKRVLRMALNRLGAPPPPRRKRGFEVPLAGWLRGPLRETVEGTLLSPTVRQLDLDAAVLRDHWNAHLAGRADHSERLLAVAVLVRWVEEWT